MVTKKVIVEKNSFSIQYDLKQEHTLTLLLIQANDGNVEFEQRSEKKLYDIDGNEISWKICDDLVDMNLLIEDEEEYNIVFNITDVGKQFLFALAGKK